MWARRDPVRAARQEKEITGPQIGEQEPNPFLFIGNVIADVNVENPT